MKKEVTALSLALALSLGLTAPAYAAGATFTDAPAEHWAYSAVEEMASRGVVSGVGGNRYAPDNTVSYAEFITMMMRQFYPDQIRESDRYYWSSGHWWSAYLLPAYELRLLSNTDLYDYLFYDPNFEGIIYNGVPSGPGPAPEITPDSIITRYEMANIIYAVIDDRYGIHSSGYDITQIADYNDITINQGSIAYCYEKGILSGVDETGAFHGDWPMTRAQAAVVMDRLLDICESSATATEFTGGRRVTLTGADVVFHSSVDYYNAGTFYFPYDASEADWTGARWTYVTINVTGYDYILLQDPTTSVYVYDGDTQLGYVLINDLAVGVKGLTEVTLKAYASETKESTLGSIILGNYAEVEYHIPDGVYELTGDNIRHLYGESKYENGTFYLANEGGFETGTGGLRFNSNGYSTLTFTITSIDEVPGVHVYGSDNWMEADTRLYDDVGIGNTKTYSVDISGIGIVSIFLTGNGNAEITNIYLS